MLMEEIAFFDLETSNDGSNIFDIACKKSDDSSFHMNSLDGFLQFIGDQRFLCGHNIINHDLKILIQKTNPDRFKKYKIIDTLLFAPILFPQKPYHRLLKDEKLQPEELNNPLNDSIKARDLFYDEISAFRQLDENLKSIYCMLLSGNPDFASFFEYLSFTVTETKSAAGLIHARFNGLICGNVNIERLIIESPVELTYCLALINCADRYSITPPWVLKSFPMVERIMHLLRSNPCITGCDYCNMAHDPYISLNRFFGFSRFREYGNKPLQLDAVRATIYNQSILVIFPTGGGKSLTFQLPALMSGESNKGLTIVISPLQSLMKDQVDNLEKKGITDAVTINGLLDPITLRKKELQKLLLSTDCLTR